MMGGGTKLAIGILVMWLAMLFFFFAFHPGGVNLPEDNPAGMLKWLMSEFSNVTGATAANATAANNALIGPNNAGSAPTPTGA